MRLPGGGGIEVELSIFSLSGKELGEYSFIKLQNIFKELEKNILIVRECNIEPLLFSILWSSQRRGVVTLPLWFFSRSGACEEMILILVRSLCFHFEVCLFMYSCIKHYALSTHLDAGKTVMAKTKFLPWRSWTSVLWEDEQASKQGNDSIGNFRYDRQQHEDHSTE